jgi:hypothetical protein
MLIGRCCIQENHVANLPCRRQVDDPLIPRTRPWTAVISQRCNKWSIDEHIGVIEDGTNCWLSCCHPSQSLVGVAG